MLTVRGVAVSRAARLLLAVLLGSFAFAGVASIQAHPAVAAEGGAGQAPLPPVSIDSGYFHTLLVTTSGTLWAWGGNSRGQLGLGDQTSRLIPVQVGTATNWKSVSAGWYHSLGVRTDGTLWAWGDNSAGQLGTGGHASAKSPVPVGTDTNWVAVSAAQSHSLGLRSDGTLWAWGNNDANRMGVASSTSPVKVGSAANWVSVAAGDEHSLGVRGDGTLWAWGKNENGQLGVGDASARSGINRVGTGTDWASVSSDFRYSMAIRRDGSLWAWGWNTQGQLGVGDVTDRVVPTRVGEDCWAAVCPARVHCVGVQCDGSLWGWGTNYDGELGVGDLQQRLSPARAGNEAWAAASAGDAFSTGVRGDGTLWGWGRGETGQLGTGQAAASNRPAQCIFPPMDWPPTVNTVPASRVLATAVTLNGYLLSLGTGSTSALVSFEWGLATSYGQATAPTAMAATGRYSAALSGLQPETWYHFRARVDGSNGTSYGADMGFKTTTTPPTPPEVKTAEATLITGLTARLNGRVADMGTAPSITISFDYGTSPEELARHTDNDTLSRMGAFYADVAGLAPGTTYYFRARGAGDGESQGGVYSFATTGTPTHSPQVETGPADRLTTSSARLSGRLTAMGSAVNVTVLFDWGEGPGSYTGETTATGLTATGEFYCDLDGLFAGRTYYYRARAVGEGTGYGPEKYFTAPPVVPAPASISPNTAGLGQTAVVTITGHDLRNCIRLDLGPGITVNDFTVVSAEKITARITLDTDIAAGPRNVAVSTANGSYVLQDGFVVKGASSGALPLWVWGTVAGLGAAICGGFLYLVLRPRRQPARQPA